MQAFREDVWRILDDNHPATIRQLFYWAVSAALVEKDERGYRHVQRACTWLRLETAWVPRGFIVDSTRWMRKPRTHHSLSGLLEYTVQTYRRALWDDQEVYVEIWREKDAVAGVLYHETSKWDVPLMAARGFSSITFLQEAAADIEAEEKPAYLYYFGDHDPSGLHVDRSIERRLLEFAPGSEIYFERVAVTEAQIEEYDLPMRSTKKSDSRSKNFVGDSVEVDAIKPEELRRICERCITQHIDDDVLKRTETIEAAERETLQAIVDRLGDEEVA